MYKIIYMKADFEPWWQFEEWQDHIVEVFTFDTWAEYEVERERILNRFRELYPHERQKNEIYYAFWKKDELVYCEGCEEDTQLYHGLILETPK